MKLPANYSQAQAWAAIRKRFSLLEDKASDEEIDASLRAGVELRGTNLWVLMFAILIASIGLNINSTAVVIGAMLISPLMGPILGIGYGVGVLDTKLIRKSIKNLGIAVAIALMTSTIYFVLSPLTAADNELLARTSPTIWDLLIALFGGFAGIIGITRKEKSNIIPGVAIATALMPPLCTAGFGIAHGNWHYFGGAFFLFFINCVFIAFSSGVVIRGFHVRKSDFVDERMARRVSRYVTAAVIATAVPSAVFTYQMVQAAVFKARANEFITQVIDGKSTHVTQSTISASERKIEVTLIGDYVSRSKLADISSRLSLHGLEGAQLELHQVNDSHVDVSLLKASLLNDLYAQNQLKIEEKDQLIAALQAERDALSRGRDKLKGIYPELHVLFPGLSDIMVSDGIREKSAADADNKESYTVVLNARSTQALSNSDKAKIEKWIRVRMPLADVKVVIETAAPASKRRTRRKA